MSKLFGCRIVGRYACFTQPFAKCDRVSYPVPTPSAIRGVLSAIYWKPEMNWQIHRIEVLKRPQYISVKKNEIHDLTHDKNIKNDIPVDVLQHRTQRNNQILYDVAYNIYATIRLENQTSDINKHNEIFNRRLRNGQHHHQPYLGQKEYTALVSTIDDNWSSINLNISIPNMLFDVYFDDKRSHPIYFDADVKNGVLEIDPGLYNQMNWESSREKH